VLSEREDKRRPSGGNGSLGLRQAAARELLGIRAEQWAQRLLATAWRDTHVYFMHEPTAPEYAKALMRFAGADR